MHFVMSQKSGVNTFEDMSGKTILLGKGSFALQKKVQNILKNLVWKVKLN